MVARLDSGPLPAGIGVARMREGAETPQRPTPATAAERAAEEGCNPTVQTTPAETSRRRSDDEENSRAFEEGTGSGDLLVFCERDGDMHILTIKKEFSLGDVYEKVQERWVEICQSNTTLHYVEPAAGFRVELRTDGDVEHMCRVHILLKKATCNMVACPVVCSNKRPRYIMKKIHSMHPFMYVFLHAWREKTNMLVQ